MFTTNPRRRRDGRRDVTLSGVDESAPRIPSAPARRNRALCILLVLAGLVRFAFILTQPTDAEALNRLPDQVEYLQLARNLLDGRGLVLRDDRFDQDVYAYRMPGYPAFVAAIGADVRAVRVAQVLVDVSTVLATVLIARRWLTERGSLFAGALVALNPFLIFFSGLILSETLYTATLVWGVYCLLDARRWVWWLGLPLLLFGIYVRPAALGLPVVLGVATSLLNWREWATYHHRRVSPGVPWALVYYVGLMALLLTPLVLTPWMLRNQRLLGSPVWLTSNGGITAYDGFNPLQIVKPWTERGGSDQTIILALPELRGMGEIERDQYLKQKASEFLKRYPSEVPAITLFKVLRTWSPVPLSADYGRKVIYLLAGAVYGVPLLVLTVVGLLRLGTLSAGVKLVLITPALYFTVVHAMTVGSLRYRIPVEPLLAVIACSALGKQRAPDEAPVPV